MTKILIVDDNKENRYLLNIILKPYGTNDMANDGQKGVTAFVNAHHKKAPFDLICLDIMMPNMDGHEALKLIREWEQKNKIENPVKIIMTTALGDSDNIIKSFDNGCEYYLIKPLSKKKIVELMDKMKFQIIAI